MAKKQTRGGSSTVPAPPAIIEHEADPADADVALVTESGGLIAAFMRNAKEFFTTARTLEERAVSMERTAATLAVTDQASDQRCLEFIAQAKDLRGTIEAHWDITTKVSKFHRRLTAKRNIAEAAAEAAVKAAERRHFAYAEEAKRRAAAEQDRIRREQEAEIARKQQEERERAEREALEAEAAQEALSDKEKLFCERVAAGQPVATAARMAGYKPDYADTLLKRSKIQAAIQGLREAAEIRRQAEARQREIAMAPTSVDVPDVKPAVGKVGGQSERSTWSAEVYDETALVAAILAGTVPATDLLCIDPKRANEYAKSMQTRLNAWPGIRAIEKKSIAG